MRISRLSSARSSAGLALLSWLLCLASSFAQQRVRFMVEPVEATNIAHVDLRQVVANFEAEVYADVDYPDVRGNMVGILIDPERVQDLRNARPDLVVVEDHELEPAAGGAVPWSPDRIDQRLGIDGFYNPPMIEPCGDNRPFIYVCDTGVMFAHNEFVTAGPRLDFAGPHYIAALLPRLIPASQDPWDHGTSVAACAVGELTGAGRCPANIISAVCYPDPGMLPAATFASYAADTIYWSLNQHQLRGLDDDPFNDASVLIFASSTTTGPSALLDLAVQRAYLGGMTVVVSAGNQNQDVMLTSPAGAIDGTLGDITMTVAASTVMDMRWAGSNYGAGVELFAPGENVLVATTAGPAACMVRSGTSYSVGYAGGAAARILSRNPWAPPADVGKVLTDQTDLTFGPSGPFPGIGVNGVPKLLYVHPSEVACIPLGYSAWMEMHDADGAEPSDGDLDCDGLANAVEYCMALDPLAWAGKKDRPELLLGDGDGIARFRFRRANYLCAPEILFEAEYSTDLINWTVVPEPSMVVDEDAPCVDGATWMVAPIPVGGERIYVRLRVTGV